jgi:hypothetical protein
MRTISDAEIARQLSRLGPRWGLFAMRSSFGDVLVGEDVPTLLPVVQGLSYIAHVHRDVCKLSPTYPWRNVLRNRLGRQERSGWHRQELAAMRRAAQKKARLQDIQHELASDIRSADKGRLYFSR